MRIPHYVLLSFILLVLFNSSVAQTNLCATTAFWSNVTTYNAGEQVQLAGVLYEAKWFTRNESPDINSGSDSEPWETIGNCDGSVDTISCEGVPVWVQTQAFQAGDQVIYDNSVYQANYYTENQFPDANSNGSGAPWTFIGACNSSTASSCDPTTPSFAFDLGGNPDSVWVSPQVRRAGLCCDIDPGERPPVRCVEFFFTLDDDAVGIIFDINSGAVPPGALYFQINCQGRYQFGELLCLSGKGPFRLTFCKPGNNPNTYSITSVGKPKVSPPITVSDGCSADIFAYGYDLSTVEWTSIPSNATWESYLSCNSMCDSVHVQYEEGAPDSVVYQVSGYPPGGCLPEPVIQTTTVYFVNDKYVEILPKDAMVCFGSTTATLTATAFGGRPPHNYVWSTGETTQSIDVGPGIYIVEAFDNSTCPSALDTAVVGAFLFPIQANAGPDQTICATITEVQLDGQIQEATGGIWSGGNGSFSPNDSTLDAIYTPTSQERINGVTLTLTSTGNRGCPGDSDQMRIDFVLPPQITAPDTVYACQNNPVASISATVQNATGVTWQTFSGGQIQPNANSLNITYTPTQTEVTNGTSELIVTSNGNNACPPESDPVTIAYTESPSIIMGPDVTTCTNNPLINVDATPVIATGIIWTGNGGTFSPSDSALNVSYTPTATELQNTSFTLIATTTGNQGCLPVSESVTINITPAPEVIASADQLVCETETNISVTAQITNASGVNWSGGNGSFSPDNQQSTTYSIVPADTVGGQVYLFATTTNTNNCLDVLDSVRVSFSPQVIITLPDSVSICDNNINVSLTAQLQNAMSTLWSTNGGGTLDILNTTSINYSGISSDTLLSPLFIIAQTNDQGLCPDVSDTTIIALFDGPRISSPGNVSVCANNPSATINTTINPSFGVNWTGGLGTFSPNRTSTDVIYTPTDTEISSGNVSLTISSTNNGGCIQINETVQLIITSAPEIEAGPNLSTCIDQASININAVTTNSNGVLWSGGDGTFNQNNANTTTYNFGNQDYIDSLITLYITTTGNTPCLEVTDQLQISLYPYPEVSAGANIAVCASQDTILLTGLVSEVNSGSWSTTGAGVFVPSADSLTTQYVIDAGEKSGGPINFILTSDVYQSCNLYTDTLQLSFVPAPVVALPPDTSYCQGDYPIDIIVNGTPGYWSGQGGVFTRDSTIQENGYTPSITEVTSGSSILKFTSSTVPLCPALSDSFEVAWLPGPALLQSIDDTICANNATISLSNGVTNAGGLIWTTTGGGNFTPDDTSQTTSYELTLQESAVSDTLEIRFTATTTSDGLCAPVRDQHSVWLVPEIILDAGPGGEICFAQNEIQLEAFTNSGGDFVWTTNGFGNFTVSDSGLTTIYGLVAADTTVDSITFIIEQLTIGVCSPNIDSVSYEILPSPLVNAGPDRSVCIDVSEIPVNGSVSNDIDHYWSTNGTGTFQNADSLNTIYFRSNADTTLDSLTLYLFARGVGGCELVYDSVLIQFTPPVSVSPSTSSISCDDADSIRLETNVTTASGVQWTIVQGNGLIVDSDSTSAIYDFVAADINLDQLIFDVTTTGNGECFSQSAQVIIDLVDQPTIATSDFSICEDNGQITLNALVENAGGLIFSTSGFGTIDSINNLSINYLIDSQDTLIDSTLFYVTSVDNGLCEPKADSFNLILTPTPTVDAGANQIICFAADNISLNGNITIATGGNWTSTGTGQFSNSASVNTIYAFSNDDKNQDSIVFTLTSTGNGSCASQIDQMVVTFSEAVVITPEDFIACETADGTIPLNPIVQNGINFQWLTFGNGTFSPSDTSLDVTYTPSNQDRLGDSVLVRFYASSCITDSADFVIRFTPGPTVVAPPNQSICEGETNELTATIEYADSVSWTTSGGGAIDILNDSTIRYSPTPSDVINGEINFNIAVYKNGCPTVFDKTTTAIIAYPVFDATMDTFICRNSSSILLDGNIEPALGGTVWQTNGTGSFAPDSTQFDVIYTFSNQDLSNISVVVSQIGLPYECLDSIRHDVTISFLDLPNVDAGPDQIVCSQDLGVVFDGDFDGASAIRWSTTGAGTFSSEFVTNPTYFFNSQDVADSIISMILETTSGNPCGHKSDTANLVIVSTPTIEAGQDKVYCGVIPDVPLNGSVINGTEWSWYSTGTGVFTVADSVLNNSYESTALDTASRTIRISLTAGINGGCQAADGFDVIFEPSPRIDIENTEACEGDSITLIGKPIDFISTNATYTWTKDGITLPFSDSVIAVTSAGQYEVTMVIDECVADESAEIHFFPTPLPHDKQNFLICEETFDQLEISAEGNGPVFYWIELDDSTKTVIIDKEGSYTYLEIDENQCSTLNGVDIVDICPPRLFTPNIFTPNNDGDNETMVVAGKHLFSYNLTIFNRWGEIIYYTEEINQFWDGDYAGEPMPEGVYNWIIEYQGDPRAYGEKQVLNGIITVVR